MSECPVNEEDISRSKPHLRLVVSSKEEAFAAWEEMERYERLFQARLMTGFAG